MSDVTRKHFEEVPPYSGPGAIPGMRFRPVGRSLGITAWGMNVIEIEAGCTAYPEHDHVENGQEEIYLTLRGSGTLQSDGTEHKLEPGAFVRVGPDRKRKIFAGSDGIAVLAVGGTPGKPYPTPAR